MNLTKEEKGLLRGMIEVYTYRASRCDAIQNRPMAERQKVKELARAALLEKIIMQAERESELEAENAKLKSGEE